MILRINMADHFHCQNEADLQNLIFPQSNPFVCVSGNWLFSYFSELIRKKKSKCDWPKTEKVSVRSKKERKNFDEVIIKQRAYTCRHWLPSPTLNLHRYCHSQILIWIRFFLSLAFVNFQTEHNFRALWQEVKRKRKQKIEKQSKTEFFEYIFCSSSISPNVSAVCATSAEEG